jgi:hypothetical protein
MPLAQADIRRSRRGVRSTRHARRVTDPTHGIPEGEIARAVVRLSAAAEQAGKLLESAADLHRSLVELHGSLTEPLVDLERLLAAVHEPPPDTPAA